MKKLKQVVHLKSNKKNRVCPTDDQMLYRAIN